jgi:hypothetical protein
MKLETTLATTSDELITTDRATESTPEQRPEIAPLTLESFGLVGGGSSIVLLG